jgi:hypothetical protein
VTKRFFLSILIWDCVEMQICFDEPGRDPSFSSFFGLRWVAEAWLTAKFRNLRGRLVSGRFP